MFTFLEKQNVPFHTLLISNFPIFSFFFFLIVFFFYLFSGTKFKRRHSFPLHSFLIGWFSIPFLPFEKEITHKNCVTAYKTLISFPFIPNRVFSLPILLTVNRRENWTWHLTSFKPQGQKIFNSCKALSRIAICFPNSSVKQQWKGKHTSFIWTVPSFMHKCLLCRILLSNFSVLFVLK